MNRHAGFVVELPTDLPPVEALRRVLDLRAHDRIIPLTRVTPAMPAGALTVGTRGTYVARTVRVRRSDAHREVRIEKLSFEPASATIVKLGRVIRGVVSLGVTSSAGACLVCWSQSVDLPWLPGALHSAAARVLKAAYRRVMQRLLTG